MLKKISVLFFALILALTFIACEKESKILTCDECGKDVEVDIDSNMEEDWIIFCSECGEPEITFEDPFEIKE